MVRSASTVAVAVVALGAASTLAIPSYGAGDFIEAREFNDDGALAARGFFDFFKGKKSAPKAAAKAPVSAAPGAPSVVPPAAAHPAAALKAPAADAKAAAPAAGAMPTVTRHLRAKPTACKVGEKASWDKVNHKPIHGVLSKTGHAHAQAPLAPAAPAAAAPHLAARSAVPTAPSAHGAPAVQPTPAPAAGGSGKKAFGAGDVIATRTMKGKNGHKTVVHVLPPRRTRCYAPAATGAASKIAERDDDDDDHPRRKIHKRPHPKSDSEKQARPAHRASAAARAAPPAKLVARAIDLLAEHLNELD